MKRLLPLLMAGIVFVIALVLIQPESTVALVIASRDLPAGHQITAGDLASREFPKSLAPTGAYEDPTPLVGQVLSIARSSGDIIYPANLGGEKLVLNSDERALAIEVSDSAGLAGLLQPGDMVGVKLMKSPKNSLMSAILRSSASDGVRQPIAASGRSARTACRKPR